MSKKTLIRMISENKGGNRPARYAVIAGKLTAAEMCSLAWAADVENDELKDFIRGNRPLDGVAAVYAASAIAVALGGNWACSLDALLTASCAASYAAFQNAKRAKATAQRNLNEAIEAASTAFKATNPRPDDVNIPDYDAVCKSWTTEYWNATHTDEIENLRRACTKAEDEYDHEKTEYDKACLEVDKGYRTALALRRANMTWKEADKPDNETK